MNNELYRKLTSITLMTIMFAGGMTIAIPGELPTAVAQTGTLSVSAEAAGVFGGPQVIEIVVDDPDRADDEDPTPDVEINEQTVQMRQSVTGKWYAYVADTSAYDAAGFRTTTLTEVFLGDLPTLGTDNTWPNVGGSIVVQTFEFANGDEVEITAGRSESVTLDYDDHSDIATISVDRNDVPAGGQVHITISDFQLNLDPTSDDAWILNANGLFTYNILDDDDAVIPTTIAFDGSNGVFGISGSDAGMVVFDNDANAVIIDETGTNTGVFESEDGDISEISVSDDAASGKTFTVEYADDSQQVIVDDFGTTVDLIADGTWDSGEPLTVRLSDENLNTNTLDDDDMGITDPVLPTMTFGTPLTIADFDLTPANPGDSLADSGHDSGTVTLTASLTATVIQRGTERTQLAMFQNPNMYHYVNYYPDPTTAL